MTIRLSDNSFAGTARTEVAVGRSSEAVMFRTTAAAEPRSTALISWGSLDSLMAAFLAA